MGKTAAVLIKEALDLIARGKFEEARESLRARPRGTSPEEYARMLYLHGKSLVEEARFHFRPVQGGIGDPYFRAALKFNAAVQFDPKFADPHVYLSQIIPDAAKALQHAQRAIDKAEAGGNAGVAKIAATRMFFLRAFMSLDQGDHAAAEADLEQVLAADPEHASAHDFMGHIYAERGENVKALYHAKLAAEKSLRLGAMAPPRISNDVLEWAQRELKGMGLERSIRESGPDIYLALSELAEREGDVPGALGFARDALARAGKFPDREIVVCKHPEFGALNGDDVSTRLSEKGAALDRACRERLGYLERVAGLGVAEVAESGQNPGFQPFSVPSPV
jgi:tetratricopeptide (TPR) repeat protein